MAFVFDNSRTKSSGLLSQRGLAAAEWDLTGSKGEIFHYARRMTSPDESKEEDLDLHKMRMPELDELQYSCSLRHGSMSDIPPYSNLCIPSNFFYFYFL